ncbi:hypothetical protein ABID23_000454 [Bartonella silvatica]|uniref:Uncharacterized protein n=1 Tax=Bartonella silvatica TaxID=357760 RepID=A0ABV2HFQ3_9HYPH
MIRFLVKLLLFLFVVFVIISFFIEPPSNHHSSPQSSDKTTTSDVMIAFKEALTDLGKFCDRNIEVCKVGKSFLSSLSERARYGARAAYEYFGRLLDDKEKNIAAPSKVLPKIEDKSSYKNGSINITLK